MLFSVKRRRAQRNEFGNATPHIYALIEAMNVVCSAGLAIACSAYLLANRLLPAEMADRALWESRIFFAAWAATVPHALLRPSASAWREQLLVAGLMCLALPVVSACTVGQGLLEAYSVADWQNIGVEAAATAFGIVLCASAACVGRR